jgi:hypothetical protein
VPVCHQTETVEEKGKDACEKGDEARLLVGACGDRPSLRVTAREIVRVLLLEAEKGRRMWIHLTIRLRSCTQGAL